MLTEQDVARYHRDGFIVVPDIISAQDITELRSVTAPEDFVESSRQTLEHTDVFDLEPGHSASQPRLRRIKMPHLQHPVYAQMVKHSKIVA